MDETLQKLGLSKKEAQLYLKLIESEPLSAAKIASLAGETRTNTYMLLERLEQKGLVTLGGATKVKMYAAVSPLQLKNLLVAQQRQLKRNQAELAEILPVLSSVYKLRQSRPGVTYFEGLEGFVQYEDDVSHAKQVDVIGSNTVPDYPEAWEVINQAVKKRYANGTKARLILHEDARNWLDIDHYNNERGYEVRFWGDQPFEADIVIYDDKLGLTSYEEALITTVISNKVIADTFRVVFENIWRQALLPQSN